LKIPILAYHRVYSTEEPECPPHEAVYALPTAEFKRQMESISNKGMKAVGLSELSRLASGSAGNRTGGESIIVLTFDDGTADHYHEVFPILREYGFKGIFFVVTGWIGRPGYLTWDQMGEMSRAGMDIQSHSESHRFLSELDEADAKQELLGSKESIEKNLSVPVTAIGIPGGYYNRETVDISKRVGYRYIFTSRWGFNPSTGPMDVLKRVSIRAQDGSDFYQAALEMREFYFLGRRIKNLMLTLPKRLLGPTRYAALRKRLFLIKDEGRNKTGSQAPRA
jgi:peptidoglycan/xylan/chitin deacetylase (PgdA/CDA1 family)